MVIDLREIMMRLSFFLEKLKLSDNREAAITVSWFTPGPWKSAPLFPSASSTAICPLYNALSLYGLFPLYGPLPLLQCSVPL
jgi:hypothetical protein